METPAAWLGLAILALTGVCLTIACWGLWMGKSIGWECAIAYYIWSLSSNGLMLFQVSDLEDIASVTGEGINPELLYIKHGARMLIAILILSYLLISSAALQWLQVDPKSRWQKGTRPLTIGIVLTSGQFIVSLLDELMMWHG